MAYVQIGDRQYPLAPGDNAVGSVEGSRVPVAAATAAVIVVEADGGAVIRSTGSVDITVNGVHLGAEPTPLIHGDKIEIESTELFFGDDRKAGNTRFVAAVKKPESASAKVGAARDGARGAAARGQPGAATGGRLVSLVDGREYAVPDSGLTVGRDPTCDVVVPMGEVSRKHAVITAGAGGYVVTDMSANGLSVNGERVASSRRLARGDVLRVGAEEFRFHADAAPARPVLATLEVKSTGLLNGTKFELHSRLTNVGRGAHNDVVLADESVSDSHATLQRREDGWYVVDMGSTNGTYVGGRRILGEARLEGAPDLRVGGIKFIFRPTGGVAARIETGDSGGGTAGGAEEAGGAGAGQTRAIAALTPEQRARLMASAVGASAVDPAASGVRREEGGGPGVGVGVAAESGAVARAGVVGSGKAHERDAGTGSNGKEGGRRRRPSLLFWIVVIAAVAIAVNLLFF